MFTDLSKNRFLGHVLSACLLQVGRVDVVFNPDKVLLDAPRRDEAVEDGHAACLVVRTTRTRTAKWLLADDRARALLVVVNVTRRVTQTVRRLQESLAFGCEDSSGERICTRRIDELKRFLEVCVFVDEDLGACVG